MKPKLCFRNGLLRKEMVYQYHRNINNAFLGGVSTAEPHGTPETSTTRSVGHGLFRERGPRKVSSVAQALWMTSPTSPPQPRRRRKGGNFLEKYKHCLSRRCEYGGAARNTGDGHDTQCRAWSFETSTTHSVGHGLLRRARHAVSGMVF